MTLHLVKNFRGWRLTTKIMKLNEPRKFLHIRYIYPCRSPGVKWLVFKRVWHLFRPPCLFPIVHLFKIKTQVLMQVFTSLIAWLEAFTFIKLHGLHSSMRCCKCIMQEDINEHDESSVVISNRGCIVGHILKAISRCNLGTQRFDEPRHLFHSFCCTIRCIFEPMCAYELRFNMDKYSNHPLEYIANTGNLY